MTVERDSLHKRCSIFLYFHVALRDEAKKKNSLPYIFALSQIPGDDLYCL